MPFIIKKSSGVKMGVANKTYYLDQNRELTEDQSKAAFVLINEGQEIPKEMADQYGIGKDTGSASKVAQAGCYGYDRWRNGS
jgi:hypothetical protein